MSDDRMLGFASATQLRAMLRGGEVSSVELLDHFHSRIDSHNDTYNLVVAFDIDRAREQAKAIDDRRARGEELGPLAGLPNTIKESLDREGLITSCGIEALRDNRAVEDADSVANLREAGAVVFGKTNLPQGASDWQSFNPIYGLSRNPWDPTRSPGGSSGGSAGAVACGFTSFELGSDIGGSIRIPAHFCGVFGHKSSYGLVSTRGQVPPLPGALYEVELGVAGPLARSAEDLALLLPILAREEMRPLLKPARHKRLQDFRIGLWMGEGEYLLDHAYRDLLEDYIAALESEGAKIERVELPVNPQESLQVYEHTLFAIVGDGTPGSSEIYAKMAGSDETGVAERLARYTSSSLSDWFELAEKRERLKRAWKDWFTRYDLLLTPQAPVLAFEHMAEGQGVHWEQIERRINVNGKPESYIDFSWQALALVADLPATCMPTARQANGLPGGLQIIGPYMEDLTTIRFAELAAQAAGGFVPPPALVP